MRQHRKKPKTTHHDSLRFIYEDTHFQHQRLNNTFQNEILKKVHEFYKLHSRIPTITELAEITGLPEKAAKTGITKLYKELFAPLKRASNLRGKKTKPISRDKKS